jgi:hypothetical protein
LMITRACSEARSGRNEQRKEFDDGDDVFQIVSMSAQPLTLSELSDSDDLFWGFGRTMTGNQWTWKGPSDRDRG